MTAWTHDSKHHRTSKTSDICGGARYLASSLLELNYPITPPPPFPWTPLAQQAVDALRGDLLPCALQIPVSIEKGLQLDKSSLAWFTQAENQCKLDATKQGIVSSHYRKTHHDQQQI